MLGLKRDTSLNAFKCAPDFDVRDRVQGPLDGRRVTVRKGAMVHGMVGAERVVVHGTVYGSVRAQSISVSRTGRIIGEVHYGTLSVDQGGQVDARLFHAA